MKLVILAIAIASLGAFAEPETHRSADSFQPPPGKTQPLPVTALAKDYGNEPVSALQVRKPAPPHQAAELTPPAKPAKKLAAPFELKK